MAEQNKSSAIVNRSPVASVDVVIVNWNSGRFLRDCLAALDRSIGAERLNLIVVDNASSDDSAADLIVDRAQLSVIRNADNYGFAKACNQGARQGKAAYVLFLNPDVKVEPATMERASAFIDDALQSDVGILGVQLVDSEGRIQRCCARTPSISMLLLHLGFLDRIWPELVPPHFLTEWDHRDTRAVDQVMGAFLLIRRAVFEQLGAFDERFFLYYEDADLCRWARHSGWRVVYFAGTRVEHIGGGSSNAVKARRLYHLAISRVHYTAKWHGRVAAFAVIVLTICLELPIRWIHAIVARSPEEGRSVLQAMAWFCKDLGKLTHRIGGHA